MITEDLKVLVFQSDINTPKKVDRIRYVLLSDSQIYQVNIDLEDIDNVLRIECHPDCPTNRIQERVHQSGFTCTGLA